MTPKISKFRLLLCIALLTFLVPSCNKESIIKISSDLNSQFNYQLVLDAKEWYDLHHSSKSSSLINDKEEKKVLKWDDAVSDGYYIEIPFESNKKKGIPKLKINDKKFNSSNEEQRISITNKNGNFKENGVLNYIPSLNYRGNLKNLHANSLVKNRFDGYVTYIPTSDTSIMITYYSDGICTLLERGSKIQPKTPLESRLLDYVCTTYEQATDWYQSVNGGSWT